MLLSIITLNYRKPQLTLNCLNSLYEQLPKEFARGEAEVIVVDNASGDNSVEFLQHEIKARHYQHVKVIANSENAGFGKGNNLGATSAKGEYLLFLNNDTLVKDQGIWEMANYLKEHQEIAILGGQLRNNDGSLQPSVGKFYTLFNAFLLLLGMQKFGLLDRSPDRIVEVDWVKGGLLMIRKEVFAKLAGFDEQIFMYTEDMELCFRAHLASLKVFFYPKVKVFHAEYGSSNRAFAIIHIYKGLLYFYKKHRSRWEYSLIKTLLLIKAIIAIIIGSVTHNSYLVTTYKKAIEPLI
ncbi:MAG TPA: glycosyltransferase family 2 protein [Patescibacteria group bacterium]